MRLRACMLVLLASAPTLHAQPVPPPEQVIAASGVGMSPGAVFLEAWGVVRDEFYDPKMHGLDWNAVRAELEPRARAAGSRAELSAVINQALSRLRASHTVHYTQEQREYYELLDVFNPDGVPPLEGSLIDPGTVDYIGVGLVSTVIDGKTFAADVYDGGPADVAGILPGDELLIADARPWNDIEAFRGREGLPTLVVVQRTPGPQGQRELMVRPVKIQPRTLFVSSIEASAKVVQRGDKSVGYVRVRSYAHPDYHEQLKSMLHTTLAGAQALVIDLRGGWGGARPEYMDIFNQVVPAMTYRDREGEHRTRDSVWRKPVVMLIDSGSRSGKEVIAYAFKKHRVGVLVGARTGGAVLAGSLRPLADGSILYVAVRDVLIDGERLEGVGVEPDIPVRRALPYSAGRDPQMEAALDAAAKAADEVGKAARPR